MVLLENCEKVRFTPNSNKCQKFSTHFPQLFGHKGHTQGCKQWFAMLSQRVMKQSFFVRFRDFPHAGDSHTLINQPIHLFLVVFIFYVHSNNYIPRIDFAAAITFLDSNYMYSMES